MQAYWCLWNINTCCYWFMTVSFIKYFIHYRNLKLYLLSCVDRRTFLKKAPSYSKRLGILVQSIALRWHVYWNNSIVFFCDAPSQNHFTLSLFEFWRSWDRASWYNHENNQQDALYRLIYYSKSAVRVSGDVFAPHQEHLTVFTVSGSVHLSCCRLPPGNHWTSLTQRAISKTSKHTARYRRDNKTR
jgi:hypothetical protein